MASPEGAKRLRVATCDSEAATSSATHSGRSGFRAWLDGSAARGARTALLLVVLPAARAAGSAAWWSVAVVQVMEGLAMGLAGGAIPALVADIMADTGHAGGGLGSVMMAHGRARPSARRWPDWSHRLSAFGGFHGARERRSDRLGVWVLGLRMQTNARDGRPRGTPSPNEAT